MMESRRKTKRFDLKSEIALEGGAPSPPNFWILALTGAERLLRRFLARNYGRRFSQDTILAG